MEMTMPLADAAPLVTGEQAAPVAAIELVGIAKRFSTRHGDVAAVQAVDLVIGEGEFFSLLGPSGCGKTTTLRMIGGFEEPTSGAIHLHGNDVTDLPPYRRDVNTVFQSYALFPHLSVGQNVAFGLERKKVPKADIERRVKDALRLVDLPGFDRRKPSQLSGGQQQRVALARALVNRPRVLLLDEPLGALDLKLRKQMQLELKRIQAEVGITFLYVTHDQEEAMTMSDRLAVMRHGRIEQIGAPEDVYERPTTEFVAGFLGASNLLDGLLVDQDGTRATVRIEGGAHVRLPVERLAADGPALKVGVRPEKIRLWTGPEEPSGEWNSVPGTVVLSTFIGVSHQYTIEGPAGRTLSVFAQNLGHEAGPVPGDPVRLVWRPEHTFVVAPSAPLADWEEE
jgi:spermidine/putrescine transport system ATP-binding protein